MNPSPDVLAYYLDPLDVFWTYALYSIVYRSVLRSFTWVDAGPMLLLCLLTRLPERTLGLTHPLNFSETADGSWHQLTGHVTVACLVKMLSVQWSPMAPGLSTFVE